MNRKTWIILTVFVAGLIFAALRIAQSSTTTSSLKVERIVWRDAGTEGLAITIPVAPTEDFVDRVKMSVHLDRRLAGSWQVADIGAFSVSDNNAERSRTGATHLFSNKDNLVSEWTLTGAPIHPFEIDVYLKKTGNGLSTNESVKAIMKNQALIVRAYPFPSR